MFLFTASFIFFGSFSRAKLKRTFKVRYVEGADAFLPLEIECERSNPLDFVSNIFGQQKLLVRKPFGLGGRAAGTAAAFERR